MKPLLIALAILAVVIVAKTAFAAEPTLLSATLEPRITVIALSNQPGIPEGWIDSTTREEATAICNALIATQSKFYANAISRSRCIIQVMK